MSVSKDTKTGTWIVYARYKNWQGKTEILHKRGFKTKREALEYEREFLLKKSKDLDMGFEKFVETYLEDMKPRLKYNTYLSKVHIIKTKIVPYFEGKSLSEITSSDIMQWQNEILQMRDEEGKGYSPTYLKTISAQMSAIFNHASRYYDLPKNPCNMVGNMGKKKAKEMLFWTIDEYNKFAEVMKDKPVSFYAVRQEWNRAADGALVSGVPEKDIMAVKHKQISEEIRDSIHKAGNQPGLFADVINRAIETLRGLTRAARVPKKPKLTVDLKEFREMGTAKESLDLIQGQIAKLGKRITAKQAYIDKLTYPWKKAKALKELSELVNRRAALEDSLAETVKKEGYSNVQRFMKTYQKSLAAIRQYEKEYAVYKEAVEKGLVVDPEVKVSIRRQLREFQEEGKGLEQHKEKEKEKIVNSKSKLFESRD